MPMMLDRMWAILWFVAVVRVPFRLVLLGGEVIVVEEVATQVVG
jgi:hypothetical protein